ncbi:hypothetical protein [Marinomonas spartinae]|uniref:hypothetical protein n=1 Tax=Marinomonas spartinae TaxID=1792290 RepID=UPI0018F2336B|nr:hypothetical protein [Marinomonas spartinae]MBJ7554802.1 hypothetical protein [Marinomonas spartinae]
MRFLLFLVCLTATCYLPTAEALESPKGPVVLSLSGILEKTNGDQQANFDMAMLEKLPQKSFTTSAPWTNKKDTYTGFSATDLLKQVDSKGTLLRITALNQYIIDIPVSDFAKHGAIFAIEKNGHPISIRDLGPILVIYPFDDHPNLQNEVYYWRSIWQARYIEILSTPQD